MAIIRREGFDFGFDPGACEACPGFCCCGERGTVWVSQPEINRLCRFLQVNPVDFIQHYLTRIDNRFSIKEKVGEEGCACLFFDTTKRRCSVYAVRPLQCREFPFWEHFRENKEEVIKECPGIRL